MLINMSFPRYLVPVSKLVHDQNLSYKNGFNYMKMNLYGERGERQSHINGFAQRLILTHTQMAI